MPKILTISENNVDDIFNEFYLCITSTIDTHAPLKKLSRKQKRLRSKPWITKGLLISIKKKQKLFKTHYIFGSINEKLYYKKYSNLLTKVKILQKNFTIIKNWTTAATILNKHGKFCAHYCLLNLTQQRRTL